VLSSSKSAHCVVAWDHAFVNLVAACRPCNLSQGSKTVEEAASATDWAGLDQELKELRARRGRFLHHGESHNARGHDPHL